MSTTDNRIVNLSFNNKQFEEGIKQSSKSLDDFEKQLEMKKGQEGLTSFQSAINKVDFSSMARGIASLEQRFSTFGIAGMNVVNRITDSIINSAKRLESATLGQIKSGGWTRASNIANAKFTIEGLKYSWDEVREAADYAVTDTAYGLDSAAKAASQLAASGVDFSKAIGKDKAGKSVTQMHKSLRAISGVAAMTNSSYDDIAHTFTRIAGQGRVMGEDLNSLAARGLNAAATLATAMNTTEAEIRDMVSKGQIDFAMFSEAMDEAYGDHAKEANKTFTGSLSNMKAALSRIGAIFAQPVIDKTNVFFVAVTDRIKEFQKALNDTTDEDGNKIIRFAGHFEQAWTSAVETASDIMHKLDLSWFGKIAEKMDSVAQRTKTFFDDLKYLISDYTEEVKDGVDSTGKTISVTAEEAAAARKVIDGAFGNGAQRSKALRDAFGADSAKRIQDYVDSVAAAGWNYEKASIKVVNANEAEAGSMAEIVAQQKLQRKIKFHTVINNLSIAFSNLGRAAKNIFAAISKVGTAIYNAFASVFGFKQIATSASAGLRGLIIRIADFTEKLIISDDTAEKIKGTATKVFEVAKAALTFLWNMIPKVGSVLSFVFDMLKKIFVVGDGLVSSLIDSDFVQSIIGEIKKLAGYLENLDVGKVLRENPVTKIVNVIFGGLESFVTKHSSLPSTLALFINKTLAAIGEINLGSFAKLAAAAWFINSAVTFMLSVRNAGKGLEALTRIPSAIASFFYGIKNAARYASYGYFALAIGKTILMVAGALVVISQIPEQSLYRALGVIIVLAIVVTLMVNKILKTASGLVTMQRALGEASMRGSNVVREITKFTSRIAAMASALKAFATFVKALAVGIVLIAAALAILNMGGVNWSTLLTLFGAVSIFILAIIGTTKYILDYITPIITDVTKGRTAMNVASLSGIFAALSLMMISMAASMVLMATAMVTLSAIPADKIIGVVTAMAVMIIGIAVIIERVATVDPKRLLAAGGFMVMMSMAIALVVSAISTSVLKITAALGIIALMGDSTANSIFIAVGVVSAFLLLAELVAIINSSVKAEDLKKFVATMLTIAVAVRAFGSAISMVLMASAFVKGMALEDELTVLGVIAGFIGMIFYLMKMSSLVDPSKILAMSALMITIGTALGAIFLSIAGLAVLGGDNVLSAALGIGSVILAMGGAIMIASTVMGKVNNAGNIVAGVLSMSAAVLIIAVAMSKLKNIKSVTAISVGLSAVLLSIAAAFAIFANLGGSGGPDTILSVGSAFIMIAAALYILALAVEKMASVTDNLVTVAVVFGVFLAVVIGLAVAGTIFAGITATLTIIGKALLYAGAGFALVGAGIFLVCAGIKILAPSLAIMAVGLETVFSVLERHKMTAIIVTAVLLGIIVAISLVAAKLAPVLKAIIDGLAGFFKAIGSMLAGAASGFTNFVSTLTTRGKVMIVSLITTICAALVSSSPKVISAIGTLILRLFEYLGKIAGSLALAIVDFIINLINGVAEAIIANSGRIINALFNVIYALASLLVSVIGQVFSFIPGADEFFEGYNEELLRIMEERKAVAEEADQSKKDYLASLKEMEEGTEESSNKSSGFLGGLFDKFSEGTDKVNGLTDAFEGNKTAFTDMIRVQGIPVEIPSSVVQDGKVVGANIGESVSEGLADGFTMEGMGFGTDSMLKETGINMGEDMSGYMGQGLINEQPELYTTTTTTIDEGPVAAIEDSEVDISRATEKSIVGPMNQQVRDSRERFRTNMYYAAQGGAEGIDAAIPLIDESMSKLVKHTEDGFIGPLKIESPSKVFMQYGGYIIQGLVNGINATTSDAEGTMTSFSDRIIQLFGNPLNYISQIASGELQVDPSIQPVLDTSRIQRGSASIGTILNGQAVTIGGLSSQLAADIGQLDSRNSDVVEEIRALREEMAIMGEEISNMQVVMDTGALVGATAAPMDKALGQRAVRFGRGN